jgi:uncharacterized membrane protein
MKINPNFKKFLLPIGIIAAVAIISALLIFSGRATPLGEPSSVNEIEMELHVAENPAEVGFDTGLEKIKFGWIPVGGYSKKSVNIENSGADARVIVKAEGEFADWIQISESKFNLASGESKEVQLKAVVPQNAQPGNYTCVLKIYFYR